ncbi:MAG: polyprenyl diphosphate synthase [Opitutales bacterium]|nr:polyprenyl diphosphate synthase [Opitutales bacterium]
MPETDSNSEHSKIRHVAIIMDGNGRWANERGLERIEGHKKGVDNVELVVKLASEIDLEVLTLFAFSSENWKRPKAEVDALMALLESFLLEKKKLLHEQKIHLRPVGKIEDLPENVRNLLRETCRETQSYPRTLALALNYGSRLEVLEAVKKYAQAVGDGNEHPDEICWKKFSKYLYTSDLPDPDLMIRTSGETRLSNFLLLQSAYAEIYYSPVNWPEFGREAFEDALKSYHQRERRFGKTGAQIQELKVAGK